MIRWKTNLKERNLAKKRAAKRSCWKFYAENVGIGPKITENRSKTIKMLAKHRLRIKTREKNDDTLQNEPRGVQLSEKTRDKMLMPKVWR